MYQICLDVTNYLGGLIKHTDFQASVMEALRFGVGPQMG